MEVLKEHFELVECISYASAVFKCVKELPDDAKNFALRESYSREELIQIHVRAVDAVTEPIVKEMLKVSHSRMLYDFGLRKEAGEFLNTVNVDIMPAEEKPELSFNVNYCASEVRKLVEDDNK